MRYSLHNDLYYKNSSVLCLQTVRNASLEKKSSSLTLQHYSLDKPVINKINYKSNWKAELLYKYNVLSSEVWKYSGLFSMTQSVPYPSFFCLNARSEFQSRGIPAALSLLQGSFPLHWIRGDLWASKSQATEVLSLLQNQVVGRTWPQIHIYMQELAVTVSLQHHQLMTLGSHAVTVWSHWGLCYYRTW